MGEPLVRWDGPACAHWEWAALVRDKASCGLTAWKEKQCVLESFESKGDLRAVVQLAFLGEKGDSPAAEWGARGLAIAEQDELEHTAVCAQEFDELLSTEEAHVAADVHAPVWHCELTDLLVDESRDPRAQGLRGCGEEKMVPSRILEGRHRG